MPNDSRSRRDKREKEKKRKDQKDSDTSFSDKEDTHAEEVNQAAKMINTDDVFAVLNSHGRG
jgi:hypothetical protein